MTTRTELIKRLLRTNDDGSLAEISEAVQKQAADMLEADGAAHAEYNEATVLMNDVLRKQLMSCQSERDKLQAAARLAREYVDSVPDDRYNATHIDRCALITALDGALK